MALFGIYTPVEHAADVQSAGGDFVEENVQELLQGELPDADWRGPQRVNAAPLPVLAANRLVPAHLKMTGPDADPARLRAYMRIVLKRAAQVGIQTLVVGSGPARTVPAGFDRAEARRQLLDFLRTSADLAGEFNVLLVAEHLQRGECNIMNTVAEAMEYVKAVDHPHFQCLVDSYHFWLNGESLDDLRQAMPWIRHVHLADTAGRAAPGETGKDDYRPFFRVLKEGGYDGPITVEANDFNDVAARSRRSLDYIKREWKEA